MDVAEDVGPADRLLNLLLAVTGRVDDDAVNSTREMLGVGQLAAAAEFLTGCLVAGQVPVNATEQHHIRRVLTEAHAPHALADRLHVVESVPEEEHRFTEGNESDRALVDALSAIASRLPGVRGLWCTWRATPAGVTYGAVPRRVLLAEVGSDGSVSAVGYQVLRALRRAGIGCSVDVFSSGVELPDYHRNALSAAHRIHIEVPAVASQNGQNRARAPRVSSSGGKAKSSGRGSDLPSDHRVPLEAENPSEMAETAASRTEQLRSEEQISQEGTPFTSTVNAEATIEGSSTVTAEPDEPSVEAPALNHHEPSDKSVVPNESSEDKSDEHESDEGEASKDVEGSKNMRVPAAVDAKLTDRERNLLRKLHEELAQREHDRGGKAESRTEQQVSNQGSSARSAPPTPRNTSARGNPAQREMRNSTAPGAGTGGFPAISSSPAQGRGQRSRKRS